MITYHNSSYAYDISCITQSACFIEWMGQDNRIKTTSLATIAQIARFITDDSIQAAEISETAVNRLGQQSEVTIYMYRNEHQRPCIQIRRLATTEGGEQHVLG